MAVPWLQIVQLVPSILDVSRELLKKSKTDVAPPPTGPEAVNMRALVERITALQENERRQAELISQMAEQISVMSRAITTLHRRAIWLSLGCGVTAVVALVALVMAARA